jgi:SAM-dependent methyltransferase
MFYRLKAAIHEQAFHPRLLGLLVNPFYFARKGLHQHIVALAPSVRGRILDVGCGSKPYQQYFAASEYVGMEIEGRNKQVDRSYDGKVFPCDDGEFDAVLSSEVLEHVFNPDEFLSEINRVLRDGGALLLTVPFVWDEHEQPYDYARYSSFGLRHLLKTHGFEIIEQRKSMDDIRVIFQMINAYIYKKTVTGNWWMNLFLTIILMAPFNVLGELFAKILPSNSDLYLDNIILARSAKGNVCSNPPTRGDDQ